MAEDNDQNRNDEDDHAGWNENIHEARVGSLFQPVVPFAECDRHGLNLLRHAGGRYIHHYSRSSWPGIQGPVT